MKLLRFFVIGLVCIALLVIGTSVALRMLATSDVVDIGDAIPDFKVQTLAGEPVAFSSLRGRTVVLNFWASWCGPCRREMPLLDAIQQEYNDRGVVVVGLDLSEPPVVVRAYIDAIDVSYPIWLDQPGSGDISPNEWLNRRFGVVGLPTTLFIDANGILRDRHVGELTDSILHDAIQALLKR